MKLKIALTFISAIFLLLGCRTWQQKESKETKDNISKYTLDLNEDGIKEVIEVEDKFELDSESVICVYITGKEKQTKKINAFSVPGKVTDISFIDLDGNGVKEICVFYSGKDAAFNIAIYSFEGSGFRNIFSAQSQYGIETDFDASVPRIRLSKGPSADYEVWVWARTKFVREY